MGSVVIFSLIYSSGELIEWDDLVKNKANPYDYLNDHSQTWFCESGFLDAFIDIYVGF